MHKYINTKIKKWTFYRPTVLYADRIALARNTTRSRPKCISSVPRHTSCVRSELDESHAHAYDLRICILYKQCRRRLCPWSRRNFGQIAVARSSGEAWRLRWSVESSGDRSRAPNPVATAAPRAMDSPAFIPVIGVWKEALQLCRGKDGLINTIWSIQFAFFEGGKA